MTGRFLRNVFLLYSVAISASLFSKTLAAPENAGGDSVRTGTAACDSVGSLHHRNYFGFPDLLFLQPGCWIRHTGYPGQWAPLWIRGGNPYQTVLTVNGIPLIDPWTGLADFSLIPVEMIDRIEIHPSSNPFGLAPVGGVVNIVEREFSGDRPLNRIVYRDGKDGFSDMDVPFGQRLGRRWNILSGLLLKSYGEALPGRAFKGRTFRTVLSFRPARNMGIKYRILAHLSDLDLPFGLYMPADTLFLEDAHRKRARTDHRLEWTWHFKKVENTLSVVRSILDDEIRELDYLPRNEHRSSTTHIALRQVLRSDRLKLHYGLRLMFRRWELADTLNIKDTAGHAYLGTHIPVLPQVDVRAEIGLHSTPGSHHRFLVRSQVTWKPGTTIRCWAAYDEGVRDPSLGERSGMLFYPAGFLTAEQILLSRRIRRLEIDTSLKPEFGRQLELGLRWQLGRGAVGSLRGYWKRTKDLILPDPNTSEYTLRNQGHARFWGAESRFVWGPWRGFQGSIVLNAVNGVDDRGGSPVEQPQFWGNMSVGWSVSFFSGDLKLLVMVSGRTWSGFWRWHDPYPDDPRLEYRDPGGIIDAKVSFTVIHHAEFSYAIDNIFGAEGPFVDTRFLSGRVTRFGFSWNLYD